MAIQLSSLKKTPTGQFPPFITIYGMDGMGKTTLAIGSPNPAYLPTEQRFSHYEVANIFAIEENPYNICGSFSDMMDALGALLTQDHDFKTVVVDTADHFEPMVHDQVIASYPYKHKGDPISLAELAHIHNIDNNPAYTKIENIGHYGFGKGQELAVTAWQAIVDMLNKLRREKNMAVIILAHVHVRQEDDDADSEAYQQSQINMSKKTSNLIKQNSDVVMFVKLEQTKAKIGDKNSFSKDDNRPTKAVGDARRVLVCQPNKAYTVKNSFSMPDKIQLPDFLPGEENRHQNCVNAFWSFAQYIPFFQNQVKESTNA